MASRTADRFFRDLLHRIGPKTSGVLVVSPEETFIFSDLHKPFASRDTFITFGPNFWVYHSSSRVYRVARGQIGEGTCASWSNAHTGAHLGFTEEIPCAPQGNQLQTRNIVKGISGVDASKHAGAQFRQGQTRTKNVSERFYG